MHRSRSEIVVERGSWLPEAIWFAFFSCSLSLGFSSTLPLDEPAFADPSRGGDGDMMRKDLEELGKSSKEARLSFT